MKTFVLLVATIVASFYLGFKEGSGFVWQKVINYLKNTGKSDEEICDILVELSKEKYI